MIEMNMWHTSKVGKCQEENGFSQWNNLFFSLKKNIIYRYVLIKKKETQQQIKKELI